MATILPLALEALMREQGRNVPNEQDMGMLGMPTGIPFTNQAPYTPRRTPMDGSLGMLSALISGLSGHAAPMQQEPAPDPQTLVMRSFMSPGGGEAGPFAHGAMLVPQGQEAMASDQLQRQFGGQMGTSMDARIAQANAAKTGQGMGIVDQAKYDAIYGPQGSYTQGQQQRQDLVRQRAMQIGQARTNRQSGMHPQLAAILAAVGGNSDLGQLALGDAVGGRGTGLQLREQDLNQDARNRAIDMQAGKQAGASTPQAGSAEEVAKQGEAAVADAIRKGDPAALVPKLTEEARAIIAEGRKKGWDFLSATDVAILELQKKHGVTVQQAQAAVEAATGSGPGSFANRKGKPRNPEKDKVFGVTGPEVGAAIGQPFVDFWRHFISGE